MKWLVIFDQLPAFRPMPTKKVSEDLSREAFGLTDMTTLNVYRNKATIGS